MPPPFLMGAPFSLAKATIYPAPTITAVSPDIVDIDGGTLVTITGTGLDHVISLTVGGSPATIFSSSPTSLTYIQPAKPVGTWNIVASTNGGSSAGFPLESWHPGDYPLTMYLRDFNGLSPTGWSDRVSAGTSGSHSPGATAVTGGTAVNGKTPAHFNGSSSGLSSGGAWGGGSLFNINSGSIIVLFNKNTAWTDFGDNGTGLDGNGIWRNPIIFSTGYTIISCSNTMVRAATHHASPWIAHGENCINNAWGLIEYNFNGSSEKFRINDATYTGLTKGGIDAFEDTFFSVGPSTDTPIEWYGGDILCMFTANVTFTDAQFDKILRWARSYYALTLVAADTGSP